MHSSLTVKNNVIVMVISAGVAAAVYLLSSPLPTVPMLVGAGSGFLVGIFQARSAAATPKAFQRAVDGADIRDALKSSPAGNTAITLHWIAMVATIGTAVWIGKPLAGTLGGWATYEVFRRLALLKSLSMLGRTAPQPGTRASG